jgi:DNA-binding transcriptional MerR regulator
MSGLDNVITAFSAEQVERLTGLSRARLLYWDRTGFFAPAYADENRRSPYSRIYSFRDVVGLRTLYKLTEEFHISLQHLRKVAAKLSDLSNDLWSSQVLYVLDKKVVFDETGAGRLREVLSDQYVNGLALGEVISDMQRAVDQLRRRRDHQIGQITRSRFVNRNAAVVAGTRIPVSAIREFAGAGYTVQQIIEEYPDLTERDITAALTYRESADAAA